jgi:type IV secretory pathway VirB10-like protein
MRLGQLARKISIRQSDMVDLLAKSGISIANESNARLDDDHVHIILQHFAPSLLTEKIEEADSIAEATAHTEVPIEMIKVMDKEPVEVVVLEVNTVAFEGQKEETIEVIKAPKVDLPGLKVLGKIDLPEPKKKEVLLPVEGEKIEVPITNIEANATLRVQKSRNVQDNRRERLNRSSANPIALQREREARDAEEKRKADAIKEKEKRTEYYLNRVKTNVPTKAARIYSESVEEYETLKQRKEKPKTLLGKFFRWLRSE